MADKQLRVTFSVNEADLKRFNDLLKQSNVNAEKLEDNLKDVGKESDSAFKQASTGINQLVTGVKAFLALELVGQLKQMASEASHVAAAGEGIRSAFGNLGMTTQNLKSFREAVGGTVNDINLMQIAVTAAQKGLGAEGLTKVLAYADKQADATGGSLEGIANIMINAIGKESTKGLQQAGLSIKSLEANIAKMGYAPALFLEMETKTKSLGDVASLTADSYDALAVSQENLKEAFGRLINSDAFRQLQGFLTSGIDKITAFLNKEGLSGVGNEELTKMYEESLKKTAELEKQYTETMNPIRLSRLRGQLEDEKELRLDIITQGQQNDRDIQAAADKKALEDFEKQEKAKAAISEQAAKDRAVADANAYAKAIKDQNEKTSREAQLDQLAKDRKQFITDMVEKGTTSLDQVREIDFDLKSREGKKGKPVSEELDNAKSVTEDMKLDFETMFDYTLQLTGLINGLGKSESGAMGFFAKLFKGFSSILTLFNPVAGGVLGGIGSLFGNFNEGGRVGMPVGANRDTVLAGLTLGEYVVKRESTKRSSLMLDAINSGKLDDRFLMTLNSGQPIINIDQDKVVKAIQSMPQIDFYKNGSVLYEYRSEAQAKRVSRRARITL